MQFTRGGPNFHSMHRTHSALQHKAPIVHGPECKPSSSTTPRRSEGTYLPGPARSGPAAGLSSASPLRSPPSLRGHSQEVLHGYPDDRAFHEGPRRLQRRGDLDWGCRWHRGQHRRCRRGRIPALARTLRRGVSGVSSLGGLRGRGRRPPVRSRHPARSPAGPPRGGFSSQPLRGTAPPRPAPARTARCSMPPRESGSRACAQLASLGVSGHTPGSPAPGRPVDLGMRGLVCFVNLVPALPLSLSGSAAGGVCRGALDARGFQASRLVDSISDLVS